MADEETPAAPADGAPEGGELTVQEDPAAALSTAAAPADAAPAAEEPREHQPQPLHQRQDLQSRW